MDPWILYFVQTININYNIDFFAFIIIIIIALNADNLAANRVVYVASTGCVDLFSYMLSILLLRFFGRKVSSCALFALAGFFLLSLLFVPRGMTCYEYLPTN